MSQKPCRHIRVLSSLGMLAFIVASLVAPVLAEGGIKYFRCTREPVLIQALAILAETDNKSVVEDLFARDTKILFKDMREFGKAYMNHDALSVIVNDGRHVIYINSKHASAPPPALAALIRHEAMHNDTENSVHEEVVAWSEEARTWQDMLERYPHLKSIPLKSNALVDRLTAVSVLVQQNKLTWQIRNNVAYKGLPEHSPGF